MPYQTIGWKNSNNNKGNNNFHQSNSYHSIIQNNNNNNTCIGASKSINNLNLNDDADGSGLIENAELIEKLFPKCRPKSKINNTTSTTNNSNNIDKITNQMDPLKQQQQQQSSNYTSSISKSHHQPIDQLDEIRQDPVATFNHQHHYHSRSYHRNVETIHPHSSSKRIWNFMGISPSPSPPPLSPTMEDCHLSNVNFNNNKLTTNKKIHHSKENRFEISCSSQIDSVDNNYHINNSSNNNNNTNNTNSGDNSSIIRPRRSSSGYDATTTAKFRLDNLLLSPIDGISPNESLKINNNKLNLKKEIPKHSISLNNNDDYEDLNDEDDILFSRTNMDSAIMNFAIPENKRSKINNNLNSNSTINDTTSLKSIASSSSTTETKINNLIIPKDNDDVGGCADDDNDDEDNDYRQQQIIFDHLAMAGGKELFSSSRSARSKKRNQNNNNSIQNRANLKNKNIKSNSLLNNDSSIISTKPNLIEDVSILQCSLDPDLKQNRSQQMNPMPSVVGAPNQHRKSSNDSKQLKDCEDRYEDTNQNIQALVNHVNCYYDNNEDTTQKKIVVEDNNTNNTVDSIVKTSENCSSQSESKTTIANKMNLNDENDYLNSDMVIKNPSDTIITCATIELNQSPINQSVESEKNNSEEYFCTKTQNKVFTEKCCEENEEDENIDSACERFAIDLKNKLSIVSKNSNNFDCKYEDIKKPEEEIDDSENGCESDHSIQSSGYSKKSSFDEQPIARLIGSVPIAQYEGSPKRYGPKPGYPKRIITSNNDHYETLSPPLPVTTTKESLSNNIIMKCTALSSENGSPNSSSTSATFSSSDVHSSSSFSCPSNNQIKSIEQWNPNNDSNSKLKIDSNCQTKNLMLSLSSTPHQMLTCDEVVKSILNIPTTTSNNQLDSSETDDAKSKNNSKTSTPLKSRKIFPENNIAVLNLIHTKKEPTSPINYHRYPVDLNQSESQVSVQPKIIEKFNSNTKNIKSDPDSESVSSLFLNKNEQQQYYQPNVKSKRSNSVGYLKQQQQTSFESTDSNKSDKYLMESSNNSIKQQQFIRPSNIADGGYSSHESNSNFKVHPSNNNEHDDLLRNMVDNKNHNKLNYICLSPETMADGKELLSESFANSFECSALTAERDAASLLSSSSAFFDKAATTNDSTIASTSVIASDGTLMLNIMPVLEDGLSSGMPSSDEMELFDDEELCCENDNESSSLAAMTAIHAEPHESLDDYVNDYQNHHHPGRTVIGCEQINTNSNTDNVIPVTYNQTLPSSSSSSSNVANTITGINVNESGNNTMNSYDYYGQTSKLQQPSQTYFSSYNITNKSTNAKYGRDVINSINNQPQQDIKNRIEPKDNDESGLYDNNSNYYHPSSHHSLPQNQTCSQSLSTTSSGHEKYCLSSASSSQQPQHSRPLSNSSHSIRSNTVTASNISINKHTSQCNVASTGSIDSTAVGSNQYHNSYHHFYHHHHPSPQTGVGMGHHQQQQPQNYPNLSNSPTLLSPNSPGSLPQHNNVSSASSSSSSSSSSQHQPINHQHHFHKSLQSQTSQTGTTTAEMQTVNNSSTSISAVPSNTTSATTAPNIRHHHDDDCDTDQETDRLLGTQRANAEDRGFFDEKNQTKRSNTSREVRWEPKVLIEGVLFRARYLGSTQLICDGQPTKATRMMQAEEAVSRIKAPEGESQPSTEVDLFISTEKIMVLNTDLKEIMMDHALRTISYIADIGDLLVLMARRRSQLEDSNESAIKRTPKMICHVFESEEAQYIAQSIGQAFQVAYMEFLKANGIKDSSFLKEMDYQEVLNSQEIFGDELEMFSKREKQKEVIVPKQKGEILGIVIVESGWGSMLPTVVIANLAQNSPSARCGQLNIGDQIIAINGISLVGLPLSTCQTYVKNTKNQTAVKFTIVPCPPVVEVKIKRPDTKYQLGFSVQNGVICSLLRGGIAERGGVRVGHRIIEINGQSVVAVPHDRIVNLLATSVGEIHMKTMPTSMFRLLTGQESPSYM